ncbi:hypothetical protein ILYODFUR_028981, partial [Ilyodon furcidens]
MEATNGGRWILLTTRCSHGRVIIPDLPKPSMGTPSHQITPTLTPSLVLHTPASCLASLTNSRETLEGLNPPTTLTL